MFLFWTDLQVVPEEEVKESVKGGLQRPSVCVEDPKGISPSWRKPTCRRVFDFLLPSSVPPVTEQKTKRALCPEIGALKNKYEGG